MRTVIMGIGVPGAGKTTALKAHALERGYTYVSPDDIRFEITGDAADNSQNTAVWEEVHRRVADALKRDISVVVDATFAKDYERKEFIRFVREAGAEKVYGVFADVPLETALERNIARDRVVPAHAVRRMYQMLVDNPPDLEDGFDRVVSLDQIREY